MDLWFMRCLIGVDFVGIVRRIQFQTFPVVFWVRKYIMGENKEGPHKGNNDIQAG